MSLSRILLIIVTLLMWVVLCGSLWVSTREVQGYLNQQLGSHAQDAATALGISLSRPLQDRDVKLMESMVHALSDSGYYQHIEIHTLDGASLLDLSIPLKVEGVPEWFIRLLPLIPPRREAVILSAWHQVGRIQITSHPGYAYKQLWQTTLGLAGWFGLMWIVLVLLMIAALRGVLAPLHALEHQARAIAGGQFITLNFRPWARDLRQVASAMNIMSRKLELTLSTQIQRIGELETQACIDAPTELMSRACFMRYLATLLSKSEAQASGALLILRLSGLVEVNRTRGYTAGNEWLRDCAAILIQEAHSAAPASAARLDGTELGLLLEGVTVDEARRIARALLAAFSRAAPPQAGTTPVYVGIAWISRAGGAADRLLSEADMALRGAEASAAGVVHELGSEVTVRSATAWREIFERTFSQSQVALQIRTVKQIDSGAVIYEELCASISDSDGALIARETYGPMAQRLKIDAQLERLILAQLLSGWTPDMPRVSLTLSCGTLTQAGLIHRWTSLLETHSAHASRLILQIPEPLLAECWDILRDLPQLCARFGCQLAISHAGRVPGSAHYLPQLRPHYLLLAPELSHTLDSQESRNLIASISELASSIDAIVIASELETQAQLATARSLKLHAGAGPVLSVWRPWARP